MRVTITARHFKAPRNVKQFAEKKIQKLKKYYDGIIECEILLEREHLNHVAEVSVKVFGQRLRAVEKSEDLLKSIELCVDKIERQLKKYKEKLRSYDRPQKEQEIITES